MCADQAALPRVPAGSLDLPLPSPASPHYPGGDHGQRLSSGGQRCWAWAGSGARPAEGQREHARPAASTSRGMELGGASRTRAVGQELCPRLGGYSGAGSAPPRPLGRSPASGSLSGTRQLAGGAFGLEGGADARQLWRVRGGADRKLRFPAGRALAPWRLLGEWVSFALPKLCGGCH